MSETPKASHSDHDDCHSLRSSLTKVPSLQSETSTLVPESNPESSSKSKPETLIFSRLAPLRVNMRISAQYHKRESLYFIDIAGMFSDNTSIKMYSKDKNGPSLAKCSFNKFRSSKIIFSLRGGQRSIMNLVSDHGYYQWSIPIPQDTNNHHITRKRFFIWRRAAELDRNPRTAEALNLELATPDPYKVHAIYAGALPGSGRGGILELNDDLGGDFKVMVLLSLSALVEKARQKRDRNGDNTARLMAFG